MKISVINGERWNLAWWFCFSLVGRHGRKYDIILYIKPTLLQLLIAASFEAINSNRHSMQCWLFHKQKNSLWVTCCWKKCFRVFCSWHFSVIFIWLLCYVCNRTAMIVKSATCRQNCGHTMKKKAVAYWSSWRARNTLFMENQYLFIIAKYACLSIHSRKQRGLYPTVDEKHKAEPQRPWFTLNNDLW